MSPDTPGVPASAREWTAPDTTQHDVPKRDIEFPANISFRTVDGNFDVLKPIDRKVTPLDIARGMGTAQEKMDDSLARLLNGLPLQLHDPSRAKTPEQIQRVRSLRQGKSTFVELPSSECDERFVRAAEHFPESKPGLMLQPEGAKSINQLSAIERSDGTHARLLKGAARTDLDDFTTRVNFLTPRMEAQALDDETVAFAMDFLEQAERPKSITQAELDDWAARAQESGLVFGFDVDEKDPDLDNFVRLDGRLFWIDGNILRAQKAGSEDELRTFIDHQRAVLKQFVGRQAVS